MPLATNPQTGEVVFLDPQGQWLPAQTAVNPQTQEKLAFDGSSWAPVPVVQKSVGERVAEVTSAAANADTAAKLAVGALGPAAIPTRVALGDETLASAVRNAPASAVQFAKDVAQPFIHPVETAAAIKDLGEGILQKIGFLSGDDKKANAEAVGQFFVDRYGSVEGVKKTIATDPVGFLGDLSLALTLGGSAAARLPGVAGKVGEVASAAGRAIDPVLGAAKVVDAGGRGAASIIGGLGTHTGGQSLREAAAAGAAGGQKGEAFLDSLRGNASMDNVVTEAKAAVDTIRQTRGDEYRAAMAKIGQDQTVLDFAKIDQALQDVGKVKTYKGQDLSPTTQGVRAEIQTAVNDWRGLDPKQFHTAEGLDALKQKLGDLRDGTAHGTPERVVSDRVYNAVRQTIVDQAPEYGKIMKAYEQASDLIREMEKTLSLNPKASVDTTLRKLQSVLRNNVNTNYGKREALAQLLVNSGAPNLITKLAGQALNSLMPRGLGKLAASVAAGGGAIGLGTGMLPVALAAGAALPFASPRIMGEAAYHAGKASNALPVLGRTAFQVGREARASRQY